MKSFNELRAQRADPLMNYVDYSQIRPVRGKILNEGRSPVLRNKKLDKPHNG